ncbi:MAG: three-Cys-motif partner protein TcmP [Synergistaceae bacterium]|nr:three-Cys-motif partner protein TcmP [Synergistaceae bacterium]
MSKDNSNFFIKKKIWSEVKDELLGYYLVSYFTKILSTGNPVLYVDCFAGKGTFDDGKLGSPLTALRGLDRCLERQRLSQPPKVNMKFIELNHYKELEDNIPSQHRSRCEVIPGKFEENITHILNQAMLLNHHLNLFLYIDPYGVKVLNATFFDKLTAAFSTAELLINLNSFGFIREACRVRKVTFREQEEEIFSDLEEYDSSMLVSIKELDEIAGGEYWQEVIDSYSSGRINCYQAEMEFSTRYKKRLRQNYKYVLDMPIRLKPGQLPKYRMVHATNHRDGCILMADNIAKRTDHLVIGIQSGGQTSIMPQTAENEMVSEELLIKRAKTLLERTTEYTRLNEFLADFYNEYGVLCDLARLSSGRNGSVMKTLEKNGYIDVQRTPPFTSTGKKSQFWQEKGTTLLLRKRR